jgi:hypothetical protein
MQIQYNITRIEGEFVDLTSSQADMRRMVQIA